MLRLSAQSSAYLEVHITIGYWSLARNSSSGTYSFFKLSRDESLISRDESLVSRDESLSRQESRIERWDSCFSIRDSRLERQEGGNLLSREGGNLLLSGTVA